MRFAEHFRQAKSAGGRVRGEVEWVKRVPKWIGVPEVRNSLISFVLFLLIVSSGYSFPSQMIVFYSLYVAQLGRLLLHSDHVALSTLSLQATSFYLNLVFMYIILIRFTSSLHRPWIRTADVLSLIGAWGAEV